MVFDIIGIVRLLDSLQRKIMKTLPHFNVMAKINLVGLTNQALKIEVS